MAGSSEWGRVIASRLGSGSRRACVRPLALRASSREGMGASVGLGVLLGKKARRSRRSLSDVSGMGLLRLRPLLWSGRSESPRVTC